MLSHRCATAVLCFLAISFMLTSEGTAQKAGENILSRTGIVSNLSGSSPFVKDIPIQVPETGRDYEVKVNFIKVETSAAAVDAYVDFLNEQAKARGEAAGSERWDNLRSQLMQVVSKADFEVLDPSGRVIGRASDLGTTTFFRTVTFTARSQSYKVRLRCASGAGVYHLTLEWD